MGNTVTIVQVIPSRTRGTLVQIECVSGAVIGCDRDTGGTTHVVSQRTGQALVQVGFMGHTVTEFLGMTSVICMFVIPWLTEQTQVLFRDVGLTIKDKGVFALVGLEVFVSGTHFTGVSVLSILTTTSNQSWCTADGTVSDVTRTAVLTFIQVRGEVSAELNGHDTTLDSIEPVPCFAGLTGVSVALVGLTV